MQIFLDSADLDEIRYWLAEGVLDGVTTNPSIMLGHGVYDARKGATEIAQLIAPRPLSVEVTSNEHPEMLREAREFASWASNIVVKIPVINEFGLSSLAVVRKLEEENIRVNVTACLSFGQATLAAKVGATYVSIFAGRVADEGHDAPLLIRNTAEWLRLWGYKAQIIVGSMRQVIDIQAAALAGAHVLTVPPKLLYKYLDHKYSRETVRGFNLDAIKATEKIAEVRARQR